MNAQNSHDWLVIHQVKWKTPQSIENVQLKLPKFADLWRFGPQDALVDEQGLPVFESQKWGGFAAYKNHQQAKAAAQSAGQYFEKYSTVAKIWSGVFVPTVHRGEVNWRGEIESSSAINCSTGAVDMDKPLALITSAGFDSHESEELPRISRFTKTSQQILEEFKTLDGFLCGSIIFAMHDGQEGLTFTLWKNGNAMRDAVYKGTLHGKVFKEHQSESMMDRISITQARLVEEYGNRV